MPIALVSGQHATASFNVAAASVAVALPAITGGGNLITVVSMCKDTQSSTAPTDDKSNTYAASAPETDNTVGQQKVSGWYAKNCIAGALTITAHFSASTAFGGVGVAEFSGADTSSPLDQTGGQVTTATTDGLSTSKTPVVDGELIWGACVNDLGAVNTTGTSFTLLDSDASSGHASEYFIQGTAAAIQTEFKSASNMDIAVLIATFKPAAAAGGGKRPGLRMRGPRVRLYAPFPQPRMLNRGASSPSVTFDPALMSAVIQPWPGVARGLDEVVASGMTPPDQLPP